MTAGPRAPFFSIIIPAYDRADVIGEAITSCRAQTCDDFEIVVVDDGSRDADDLQQVLEGFGDDRMIYHRQENGGAAAARNTGMELAKGQYFAFLDSDDRFLPTKLERFRDLIGARKTFAGFAPAIVDRGKGRTALRPASPLKAGEPLENYFFSRNQMIQSSQLVVDRQSALDARFQPDILVGEDLDFCLAIEAAGVKWEMLNEPLSIWFDVPKEGRSGDYRGALKADYRDFRTWSLLSKRGRYAYEGTVGAFHTAPASKMRALKMLALGPLKGGVSPKVTARQALRCFLPRSAYHGLVARALDLTRVVRRAS